MRALLIACLLASSSCGGLQKLECVDHGSCPEGTGCVEGYCSPVECFSSADCDVFNFCNPSFECQEGCETDDDCTAGDTCDKTSHTCSTYGCRSTELDCDYGETCDASSGECEQEGEWCETGCNVNNLYSCGTNQYCIANTDGGDGYCWNFCEDNGDCPRGFECVELGVGYDNICYGDCDYMTENGFL